ncbi:MAG TPA: bifunctional diguanylate cyclase/phosphodiesterase [Mycobacteriales bacterium]|nr:bifunctional diguanylate cyclase/phosphodiesterase [Mycobacteriales bacterium]
MTRAWRVFAAAGLAICLVYPFLDAGSASRLYLGVSLTGLLALAAGIRLHRPEHPAAWWFLAAGIACFVVGDALFTWYDSQGLTAPSPGAPDAIYLLAYPLLFIAVGTVVHASGVREAAAWLDAGIWTGGAVVVAWLPLLAPFVHDTELTTGQRMTALAYPCMDMVLLLLVVHQLSSRRGRSTPHRLVLVALMGLLLADVVYGVRSLDGTYGSGEATDVGWLVMYVALGTAALHPRMGEITARRAPIETSAQRRALALAIPAMAPPALLMLLVLRGDLEGDVAGGVLVATAAAAIFFLSALRGRGLFADLRAREAVLEATLDERGRLAEELRSRATRCDLTGLVNRTGFLELVTAALDSADPIAVGLLDLDDFKGVNDTLGHDAGDALLVVVAARLRGAVGPRDVVGRLGGDEFAILLRGDVGETATRLVHVLGAPLLLDGQELRVEASLGVVERTDQSSLSDLLRRADVAMYAAKAAGGNRWLGYRPEMSASLLRRLDLRTQLVLALERNEIIPWFQPIVDLQDGRLMGFEALARWVRPGREVEAPGDWISLAEQTGLVVPIDFAVLESALRELARWRSLTPEALRLHLAVNASGRTLQEPGTAARVLALLARTGVPAECLVLEVTEGVLLEDEAVGRRLQHLRAEGVRIALDDFGTGWSSLSYLSRFPVDVLKLDRSFTATLHHGPGGEAVPAAVVQLARALDLQVVAEGIETAEQAARLRSLGAQLGQGYLHGRPADAPASLAHLLAAGVPTQPVR